MVFSGAATKEGNQKLSFRKAVEVPLERNRQLLMEGKEPIDAAAITFLLNLRELLELVWAQQMANFSPTSL